MKNIIKGLIIFLFIINNMNCDKIRQIEKTEHLFYILEPTNQRDDLLFMVESTNVPEIGIDSASDYLTEKELSLDSNTIFKHFGRIYENNNFDLDILLRIKKVGNRNYVFILRTFDNERKIIDSFPLAMRIDEENKYCYGSINHELVIKQKYQGKKEFIMMVVNQYGKIQTFNQK